MPSEREFKPGDRVRISPRTNPTGTGTVVRADKWTASVRLDDDGIGYLFGVSALTHFPPEEAPMQNERFCVDCLWHKNSLCDAPQHDRPPTRNLVSGELVYQFARLVSCEWQREQSWIAALIAKSCGARGRFFTPKDVSDA